MQFFFYLPPDGKLLAAVAPVFCSGGYVNIPVALLFVEG